ncbi:hypothetical protein FSP39_023927 [Pinctada imbricata]|uniref:C1q domain-containing protein n=1 Tax=Pinctada imbricata TaxID=66713 RepID=A0AA89C499_PINIB|nr:hypothetical protein FSP39_023927 [Pinctada imbricata]
MADSRKVAFFANTVSVGHNLKIHQPLTFGNVITNVGNSYHKETGMFLCTVPGYYAFSANVLVDAGNTIRTTIVKNGSVMQQIYSGDPAKNSNGGATIVLHVKPGDLVWVRLETTDGPHAIDWESNFTGFLLYKD